MMKTCLRVCGLWMAFWFGFAGANAVPVTFQVNMEIQKALGNFNPATDSVLVSGTFNNWATDFSLTANATASDLYQGTYDVVGEPGNSVQHKFILSTAAGLTWEGNVGTGSTTGNRTFTLAGADQTLPVVYFNNVTNRATVTTSVTFQIDMSVQSALGSFNSDSDTLSVAGDFNAWSTTALEMAKRSTNANVWKATTTLTAPANSMANYKFVMNGSVWENNGVGTNGAQNRSLILASNNPLVLPLVSFDDFSSLGKLVISPVSAGQATLSWPAHPNVRMQSISNLVGYIWWDVPNTAGQGSNVINIAPGSAFYRLVAP